MRSCTRRSTRSRAHAPNLDCDAWQRAHADYLTGANRSDNARGAQCGDFLRVVAGDLAQDMFGVLAERGCASVGHARGSRTIAIRPACGLKRRARDDKPVEGGM